MSKWRLIKSWQVDTLTPSDVSVAWNSVKQPRILAEIISRHDEGCSKLLTANIGPRQCSPKCVSTEGSDSQKIYSSVRLPQRTEYDVSLSSHLLSTSPNKCNKSPFLPAVQLSLPLYNHSLIVNHDNSQTFSIIKTYKKYKNQEMNPKAKSSWFLRHVVLAALAFRITWIAETSRGINFVCYLAISLSNLIYF